MKNLYKFFGIAALLAAMVFYFSACGGSGMAKAKFRFSGTQAPVRSVVSRSLGGTMMAFTASDNFAAYSAWYAKTGTDGLGSLTKDPAAITPENFMLNVSLLYIIGEGGNLDRLLMENRLVDFKTPVNITVEEEVLSGTYDLMTFDCFNTNETLVKFQLPAGVTFNTNKQLASAGAAISGNVVTIELKHLFPGGVRYFQNSPISGEIADLGSPAVNQQIFRFCYVGNSSQLLFTNGTDTIKMTDIYPGFTYDPNRVIAGGNFGAVPMDIFVLPFKPIYVPDDANAVRFEVYWDLTGLIEHYKGVGANGVDDIFVLKNGWWNGLALQAFIE